MFSRVEKAEYALYNKPLHTFPQYATAHAMSEGLGLALEVEQPKQQDNNPGRVWPRHK